jgi:hypothetical protein
VLRLVLNLEPAEAQDFDAFIRHPGVAGLVSLLAGWRMMRLAIEFDYEHRFVAKKVRGVRAEGVLAAELHP